MNHGNIKSELVEESKCLSYCSWRYIAIFDAQFIESELRVSIVLLCVFGHFVSLPKPHYSIV